METTIGDKIVRTAKKYIDLQEVKSNKEWLDLNTGKESERSEEFKALMIKQGLGHGEAYCMAAARYFYTSAHKDLGLGEDKTFIKINKLLNNSVMMSYNALDKEGLITEDPVSGAIFFMINNNDRSRGHAGIVMLNDGEYLQTIEANTLPSKKTKTIRTEGSDSEGDGVYTKKRKFELNNSSKSLTLIGFVNPVQPNVKITDNSLTDENGNLNGNKLLQMYASRSNIDISILDTIPKWLKATNESKKHLKTFLEL